MFTLHIFTFYILALKLFLLYTYSAIMMVAGLNHIFNPRFYKTFIPKWLPLLTVNYVFGVLEFMIGFALLFPEYRAISAWVLLGLMIFFLPFHLLDVFKDKPAIGSKLMAYIRLPLQFVLIWWAWYLIGI